MNNPKTSTAIGFIALFAFAGVAAAVTNAIDMGEAGDYRYFARPTGAAGDLILYEVVCEKSGVTEAVSEFQIPATDKYYAGISPDANYFYVAYLTITGKDYRFIVRLYSTDGGRLLTEINEPDVEFGIQEFVFACGKLYYLVFFYRWTVYELDPQKPTGEEIMVAHYALVSPDDECIYYTEWWPDNRETLKRHFGDDYEYHYTLEPEG